MGAVKEMTIASTEDAAATLVALQTAGASFVLTADRGRWYWYLPNLDVTPEQDDWIFHALRHGQCRTFAESVMELNAALRRRQ